MAKFTPKTTKAAAITEDEAKTVVIKASSLKPEDITRRMGDLALQIQSLLGAKTTEAVNAIADLAAVNAAIEVQQKKLADLFGVEKALLALDEVQAQVAQAIAEQAEADAELAQARKREEAEFQYALKITRQREADNYADGLAKRNKAEREERDSRFAVLDAREEAVAAREAKVTELESLVAGFDAELKAAVDKAVAIATAAQKKEYEAAKALAEAKAEGEKKLLEQQAESLRAANAKLEAEIAVARATVDAANTRITEIAGKFADSGSGQVALAAVMNKPNGDQPSFGAKGR